MPHAHNERYSGPERRKEPRLATADDIEEIEKRFEAQEKKIESLSAAFSQCHTGIKSEINDVREGYKSLSEMTKSNDQKLDLVIQLLTSKVAAKTTNIWVKVPWQLWAAIAAALASIGIYLITGDVVNFGKIGG